jgi:hypothetical protein
VVENGRLRRREIRVLPKFTAFDALAPDAFVFGRHDPLFQIFSANVKQFF